MGTTTRSRKAEALSIASGCLYVVSFLLPVGWNHLSYFGWQAFVASAFLFTLWPMWAANPVFWFGLAKAGNRRWKAARNAGVAAMLLAVSEAWIFLPELSIGYYCWLGSMIALTVAGAYGAEQDRPVETDETTAIQVLPDQSAVRIAEDTSFVATSVIDDDSCSR